MKVAMDMLHVTEEDLQFAQQIGVTDLVTRPEYSSSKSEYYEFERLVQLRTRVESAGLRVAAMHGVPAEWDYKIRLGLPGRDEQIENYCQTLMNVGRAGIPIFGYNFHADKVWRTGRHTRDRGGALVTSYDHALMRNAPRTLPRGFSDEERWESLEYFIKRVMPVAESAGVKMALHPDDPPISPVAGAAYILRDIPAFQRVLDMAPSPSNGLLFCQGCFTELLGQGVFDAIRHFGGQGKVFYVHFRNVVGVLPIFRETFMDSGDINMFEAMKLWKEVGFDGPMMPDHYPHIIGDSDYGHRSRALANGYMKALMAAVGAL